MTCFTLITRVSVEGTRMKKKKKKKKTTTTMEFLIVLVTGLKNVRLCN